MNRTKFVQGTIAGGSQSSIWNNQKNFFFDITSTCIKGMVNNKKCLINNSLLHEQPVELVKYGAYV